MQKQENKTVLAVVSDLFFSVKISDAAKRAGIPVEFIKNEEEVMAKAKTKPTLIIFDLNFESVQPLKLISQLKTGTDFKGISVIGYLVAHPGRSEVQAQEAGCDMVMARSAFSQNLPQILKRHSGSL